MAANQKPAANSKARELLKKLQALAERGIEGEKLAAQRKLARLMARLDFSTPEFAEGPDLFRGSFARSTKTKRIYSFARDEFDVANSVKWAIESATKIKCVYRDGELLAEAAPGTIKKLTTIAAHIAHSFQVLLQHFSALDGVSTHDRGVFVMGLYDGMMNEVRAVGQRLPSRPMSVPKGPKTRRATATRPIGLHIHPYTVALGLGKQIRFSASLDQIVAELEAAAHKALAHGH